MSGLFPKFPFLEKYELDRIQFKKMAFFNNKVWHVRKNRKSKHYGVSGPVSFCG